MHWYVVHTFSGFENREEARPRRRHPPSRAGATVSASPGPDGKVVEVKDGQKKTTTRKVYPGYMFVQMEVDNETWHVVTSTPKVTGFIGGEPQPAPIRSEVKRIDAPDHRGRGQAEAGHPLRAWRRVRIVDGPFATMKGKVEEVNQTRAKLRVMVSIFGRPTSVELDYTQVERLS